MRDSLTSALVARGRGVASARACGVVRCATVVTAIAVLAAQRPRRAGALLAPGGGAVRAQLRAALASGDGGAGIVGASTSASAAASDSSVACVRGGGGVSAPFGGVVRRSVEWHSSNLPFPSVRACAAALVGDACGPAVRGLFIRAGRAVCGPGKPSRRAWREHASHYLPLSYSSVPDRRTSLARCRALALAPLALSLSFRCSLADLLVAGLSASLPPIFSPFLRSSPLGRACACSAFGRCFSLLMASSSTSHTSLQFSLSIRIAT